MNYKSTISIKGHMYETLADIFPENGKLNILIIGKTPSFKSIVKGHYFQGTRGHYFWKKMNELGILKVPEGEYSDDYLLKNHCGITHISKIPRELKNLDKEESLKGYKRLCEKLKLYEPKLLIFSYKNGLDSILSAVLDKKIKARYGFNPEYDYLFNSAVFVFPMPGTICTKAEAEICFDDLINYLKKEHFVK